MLTSRCKSLDSLRSVGTTTLPASSPAAILPDARPRVSAHATGSRVSETQLAERATGYLWGEPRLRGFVEEIRAEAEAAGDDRLEQVARRFLG